MNGDFCQKMFIFCKKKFEEEKKTYEKKINLNLFNCTYSFVVKLFSFNNDHLGVAEIASQERKSY